MRVACIVVFLTQLRFLGAAEDMSFICPVPYPDKISPNVCNMYSEACKWDTKKQCYESLTQGYKVQSNSSGFTHTLTKLNNASTMFQQDIGQLQFQVNYFEKYHVQMKIIDPENARYEVPIKYNYGPRSSANDNMLEVEQIAVGDRFNMRVKRKDTGTFIFDQVGPFVFEKQFIEFTVKLNSTNMYGFGENPHMQLAHNFKQRTTYPMFSRDQPVSYDQTGHYGVYPYYVNIEDEYGNTHSVFIVNSNAMEYSTFTLDDGSPAVTLRSIGGIIDIHIFAGPTPEDVNVQFATFVGKPNFPPFWSLGFQLSRWGYHTLDTVKKIHERMKNYSIPQDVQYFDIDYMDGKRDFTYDKENFAGLPNFINTLLSEGVKTVLILDPAISINSTAFGTGKKNDAFIKWDGNNVPKDQPAYADSYVLGRVWPDNQTVFPDFMNNNTQDWWSDEISILHNQLNFSGVWIDMNEPSNFDTNIPKNFTTLQCSGSKNSLNNPPYPTKTTWLPNNPSGTLSDKTLCMEVVHSHGGVNYSHYDVHSLYGHFESEATHRALQKIQRNQRKFILSRSTYPGTGVYASHWLGDNSAEWEMMRMSIVGMLEFNMFAIPHVGADICGFFGSTTAELCTRWMQLGSFYPFSRNHNTNGTKEQNPTEWEDVAIVSRKYLSLRYSLLPYLNTLFYEANSMGHSVARPLFNQFTTDSRTHNVSDQFMWGTAIMFAPVVHERKLDRDVYLPEGTWYRHGYEKTPIVGKKDIIANASIEELPIYFRGGSILTTFTSTGLTTAETRKYPMSLWVYLDDSSAAGKLYWDDGITENSTFAYYDLSMTKVNDSSIKLQITLEDGVVLVKDLAIKISSIVVYGDLKLKKGKTLEEVKAGDQTLKHNQTDGRITAVFKTPITLGKQETIYFNGATALQSYVTTMGILMLASVLAVNV